MPLTPGTRFGPTEVFNNASLMFRPGAPGWPGYDVLSGGRFLMVQRFGEPRLQFNVVLNRTRALRRP